MSTWLVIFIGMSPDDEVVWREIDATGNIIGSGTGFLSYAAEIEAENVAIVVSGVHVTCIDNVSVNVKTEKEARSLAQFAIEDDLACKLGDAHVVLAPQKLDDESADRTLFAVSEEFMNSLVDALKSNEIQADIVVPDYSCINKTDDSANAIIAKDYLSVRYGEWGASIDLSLGPDFVSSILNTKAENLKLECVAAYPSVDPAQYGFPKNQVDAFDLIASNIPDVDVNLLQGAYSASSNTSFLRTPNIITVGVIVAISILANIGVTFLEISQINSKTSNLIVETRELFQKSFPQLGNVRDIRTQLRFIESQNASGEPDFLVLTSLLSIGIERTNGISVQSVRFDTNSSELIVNVLFDSFNSLAQLTATIESLGGSVADAGSQQAGQRRSGELVIRRIR